ncbi:MAG: hypothetical protein ABJL55_03845 [Roseibium sp.]
MTAFTLCVLAGSELCYLYLGFESASILAVGAFCAIILVIGPTAGLREWLLFGLSLCLSAVAIVVGEPAATTYDALKTASFFAAFIFLVTLLKEAAERSPSILAIGTYLTSQPAGRRYYATAFGGHFFGVLLNFGAISLLAPLVQRGARVNGRDRQVNARAIRIMEQRQLSALIRGFSWIIIWAPTALTQAVILFELPQADPVKVITLGLVASLMMIVLGRVEDRVRWRATSFGGPKNCRPFPRRAVVNVLAICGLLIGPTILIASRTHLTTASALMLMAPIVFVLWIAALSQAARSLSGRSKAIQKTLGSVLSSASPGLARNAFSLGASGFIGIMAAALAPVAQIAEAVDLTTIPGWLFLAALPVIITLGGQLALSPIMVVVFLASIIRELTDIPVSQTMIAFSLASGWALSMTASPNATATLLISGVCGVPPTTLTWRWNGWYAFFCFLVFCLFFFVLT